MQPPIFELANPVLQVLAYVNKVQDVGSDVDHNTFTLEQVISHLLLQLCRCADDAPIKRCQAAVLAGGHTQETVRGL